VNRINWSRVIVGGLVAGVVLNVGEWLLNGVILKSKMDAAMAEMGMEPLTGSDIGIFVAMTFVLGILLVWLYAAIRPRYGPGPKAAILSGFVGWIFLYVFWFVYNLAWQLFPQDLVTTSTIWGFFELPIGTVIGAWLYREEPASASRTSP
jgi:hypothetical protein